MMGRPEGQPGAQSRRPAPADPCAMVLFGATGDLTNRLVVPALYNLARTNVLPAQFSLIGVARADQTTQSWRDQLRAALQRFVDRTPDAKPIDDRVWQRLADTLVYVQGDLTTPDLYNRLRASIEATARDHGTRGNAIFYLAVADRLFGTLVEQLGRAKLLD